jgi:hypothetical protein
MVLQRLAPQISETRQKEFESVSAQTNVRERLAKP